jgi:Fe-S-cluster-containing hydrogenase component 2
MKGITVQVTDKCIGCGTCTKGICFVNAIELSDNKAIISEDCRGCGRCIEICPNDAIELKIEDSNYIKNSIEELDRIIEVN